MRSEGGARCAKQKRAREVTESVYAKITVVEGECAESLVLWVWERDGGQEGEFAGPLGVGEWNGTSSERPP